jgi:hypothetical protein
MTPLVLLFVISDAVLLGARRCGTVVILQQAKRFSEVLRRNDFSGFHPPKVVRRTVKKWRDCVFHSRIFSQAIDSIYAREKIPRANSSRQNL